MSMDFDFSKLTTAKLSKEDNHSVILIEREDCVGSVCLFGGQVLSFTPHGQYPVLWHNPSMELGQSAIRQGIPVCWPWFGDLAYNETKVQEFIKASFSQHNVSSEATDSPSTKASLSNHGIARTQVWELLTIEESDKGTEVLLCLEDPKTRLKVLATYLFGNELHCRIISKNLSPSTPAHFSFALHSYFSISHINQVSLPDFDGIPYLDALERWSKHLQDGPLEIKKETDRVYYSTPSTLRIKDTGWRRTIVVDSKESKSAIVWNPWVEKSKHLSQFTSDAYQSMLCLETAKTANDFVSLPAGDSHVLDVVISSYSH